jgi:transcriptional regulator with XRE-family HTH domain
MDDREPTIRCRELARGLREAMESAGLNGKATARALGWSETRLSRVLTGKRGVKEVDVASFLGVCAVTGAERARLLDLCREQDKQGWWRQYGLRLPQQLVTLIDHENRASHTREFHATLVPGLLQTSDYAHALMLESGRLAVNDIADWVAMRLARQTLFSKSAAKFEFFVHEFALRLPIGGSEVMSEQLHHLLRMAGRPRIAIRVVPAAIGGHAGTSGSFTLWDFPDYQPVAYVDGDAYCLFLEKPHETGAYRDVADGLDDVALTAHDSKEMIANLAIELYSAEGNRLVASG